MADSPRQDARALAPILSVVFVGSLGFSIVLPFLIFLVIRFGGNPFVYGVVGATYSAFQLLGAPILGRWSDRFGRRPVLLLSQAGTLLAWLLFLVALQLPTNTLAAVDWPVVGSVAITLPLVLLFLARALDGLTGGNVSVANAYLADITMEEDRSASFGKMAAAQNIGFIAGPALAGVLGGTALRENVPVLVAILISCLALWIIWSRLPYVPPCGWTDEGEPVSIRKVFGLEMRDCHTERDPDSGGWMQVLRLPSVGRLLAIQFLVFLAFNFFYVGMPTHAASALSWTVTEIGFFLSFLSLLMAGVQGPGLSWLSNRMSERALASVGGVILAASFVVFAVGPVWSWLLAAALLAVGNGTMWPSLMSLLSRSTDASHQGAVQGVSGSLGAIASILGLVAGGILYTSLGAGIFLVAGAAALLAWVGALRIPVALSKA